MIQSWFLMSAFFLSFFFLFLLFFTLKSLVMTVVSTEACAVVRTNVVRFVS